MTVYTVRDIQKILKISRTAAYALVNSNAFPVMHIGRNIRVLETVLYKWMSESQVRS